MNKQIRLAWADNLTALGLVTAAIGILLQVFAGVANIQIPVGAIVLLVIAPLIVLRVWRWTTTVGGVVAVLILVGAFIAPGLFNRLSNPAELAPFSGTVLQLLGLVTAIIASSIATLTRSNTRPSVVE